MHRTNFSSVTLNEKAARVSSDPTVLMRLMSVIEDRCRNRPGGSYTTRLVEGGIDQIGAKIMEEAGEVIEAAAEQDPQARSHVVHEAADLIFHLFVLLGFKQVGLDEVEAELARRFGVSGLEEKASRHTNRQTDQS